MLFYTKNSGNRMARAGGAGVAAGHVPPARELHISVVTIALFSKTRVVEITDVSLAPAASTRVWTMDALPGNMTTVPFTTGPAPGGTTWKPMRPADRCG